ncbi:hypothetical protein, variant 2 [Blastomyces dermatitidis ER-3]|uniref:Uncharacterized protein n=1 Tax=Ajellomyces dermatitidis (strain ER-3 / ATCC MYA-2586) TaxID=559297 RepID=A0ABX2VWD2_AJEDR|nr:hypothetical protein, variant 1 [Blastomyces dermatitidis ER-3]XP_045281191.1 hypothetical protein, variant 2 [Blastomyces dermatitidis ER-3]OAT01463.1 hypothetical protein, variant 1 [Blastomyces dermatitidis ER-3]OAT01464.1 hypothetical protein, variant 2 [Blastomyces dermatitidis ER-3]
MDGDSHQRKTYGPSGYRTGSGIGQHPIRHLSGSSSDRFRHQQQPEPARGPDTHEVIPQDRTSSLSAYGAYVYTEPPSCNTPSLQGGTLQGGGLQYESNFSSTSPRNQQPDQQQQRLSQYDGDMVYGITPQVQPQAPYEGVSQYQPRQSAAIEVLATQFGVPQYFQPAGPAVAGVSDQYLTASQVQSTQYSQPASPTRASTTSALPEIMADLHASAATEGLEHADFPRESPSGFDDAYNQYQRALRQTFENTRSGRLLDASQSLLEISEWLLGNATELELRPDRIKLWNEFNTCWLAVCQKQKDMTQEVLETRSGATPQNLLTEDILNKMGRELVRLCDRMEEHGLVDYQMGVWEEEILSVLGQCLDLLEGNENNPTIGSSAKTSTSTVPR